MPKAAITRCTILAVVGVTTLSAVACGSADTKAGGSSPLPSASGSAMAMATAGGWVWPLVRVATAVAPASFITGSPVVATVRW